MLLVVEWLVGLLVGLLVGCGRGRNCGCLCLLSRSLSLVCFFVLYVLFCFVRLFACLLGFLRWLVVVVIFKKDKISEVQKMAYNVQHVSSKNTKLRFSKKKTDA